jgi:hypothetical protein
MQRIILGAVLAAACLGGPASAYAANKCNIVGSFTDSLGSKGKFTTEKRGTVDNGIICAKPYALTVTTLTKTVIDVKGASKDKSCGALTGSFTFQNGGCTSATGTVTITGIGTLNDTITRTGAAKRPTADTSGLSSGLK